MVNKNNKILLIETIVTLIHDNITNIFLAFIAVYYFGIKLKYSLAIWGMGQVMNFTFSYARRWYFQKVLID
ncbi:MAG TPA: hypothetical protein DEG69_05735 [Flavobacteriaceae bacterium]|nr:hypothetical protein [Flavobacteriaceae bacterium]|tara:strand:- start:601 stop:813 length:213 start_codon:yes stop_codon:yes gene_type:complete